MMRAPEDEPFRFAVADGFPFADPEVCQRVRTIDRQAFGVNPSGRLQVDVIDDEVDFFGELAREFVDRIAAARQEGRTLNIGVPSGPARHFPLAARLINARKLSLDHIRFFALAEYADESGRTAPRSWRGSFQQILFDGFFDLVDPGLRPLDDAITFPTGDIVDSYSDIIAEAGGLDVCYGGVGWAAHFAFWEPQLGIGWDDAVDEYCRLGSRLVSLHPTSVLQVALGRGGDWAGVPPCATTIGPRDVLQARERRFWLTHALMPGAPVWQRFIARLVAHGPVAPTVPASLLQLEPSTLVVHGPVADALEHR